MDASGNPCPHAFISLIARFPDRSAGLRLAASPSQKKLFSVPSPPWIRLTIQVQKNFRGATTGPTLPSFPPPKLFFASSRSHIFLPATIQGLLHPAKSDRPPLTHLNLRQVLSVVFFFTRSSFYFLAIRTLIPTDIPNSQLSTAEIFFVRLSIDKTRRLNRTDLHIQIIAHNVFLRWWLRLSRRRRRRWLL